MPCYEPDPEHMPATVPAPFRVVVGPRHDGHVDACRVDPTWGGAAGAVVSTAPDWSRFLAALMSGQLLPTAQLNQMLTTVPMDPTHPNGPASGLGIETATTGCGTVWTHDGGIPGYSSRNLVDRTGTRTASMLVSTELLSEFDADPKLSAADQAVATATICATDTYEDKICEHNGISHDEDQLCHHVVLDGAAQAKPSHEACD